MPQQVQLNSDKCKVISIHHQKILKYRRGTTLCFKQRFVGRSCRDQGFRSILWLSITFW